MSQKQKRHQIHPSGKNLKINEWDRIRQNRLRRLHAMTNSEIVALRDSIPKARLDMWCHLNAIVGSKNNARQIFYKAITQSCIAFKSRGVYQDIIFHRDLRAEFTSQIYKQLFCKIDPKLEVSEEICKYLDS